MLWQQLAFVELISLSPFNLWWACWLLTGYETFLPILMPIRRLPIKIQAFAIINIIQSFMIVMCVISQVLPPLPVNFQGIACLLQTTMFYCHIHYICPPQILIAHLQLPRAPPLVFPQVPLNHLQVPYKQPFLAITRHLHLMRFCAYQCFTHQVHSLATWV